MQSALTSVRIVDPYISIRLLIQVVQKVLVKESDRKKSSLVNSRAASKATIASSARSVEGGCAAVVSPKPSRQLRLIFIAAGTGGNGGAVKVGASPNKLAANTQKQKYPRSSKAKVNE